MAFDDSLAEHVMPHDRSKTLAPHGHVPLPMGWDLGPTVNHGGDLHDREVPAPPLRNACEIRRGPLECCRGGSITPPFRSMARTTVPDIVAVPHLDHLGRAERWWLRRKRDPQKGPSYHDDTKTKPLHVLVSPTIAVPGSLSLCCCCTHLLRTFLLVCVDVETERTIQEVYG